MKASSYWFIFLIFFVTDLSSQNCADERAILAELFELTQGENWTVRSNWLSDAPLSDWYGVRTDEQGCVVGLQLYDNGLTGSLPSSIARLTNLTTLVLDRNQLSGSIPPEIGNLSNLSVLSLSANNFSGSIPETLGGLANLRVLYLHINQLTGSVPASLGNLANLSVLYLSANQLTSAIPPQLGSLSQLTWLALDNNQFNGTIPSELGNLQNLNWLWLYNNQLSGPLPASLGQLTNLKALLVRRNNLSGCFPATFENLCYLVTSNESDCSWNNNNRAGCQFDFSNNPSLAWQGDFSRFCNGESQIGAFCDDKNLTTTDDRIQSDCTCGGGVIVLDQDNDGHEIPADCNDNDPTIHPDAVDIPDNGIDENCDGIDASSVSACLFSVDFFSSGGACNADGLIALSIDGAPSNYQIKWSGPVTDSISITTMLYVIEDLSSGNYVVEIIDNNGCSIQEEIQIGEDNNFSIDLDSSNGTCGNKGNIAVSIIGGQAPYTISWVGPKTGSLSTERQPRILPNLPHGRYTVTVTDRNGCVNRKSVNIEQGGEGIQLLLLDKKEVNCNSLGICNFRILGNNPPYTLQWKGASAGSQISQIRHPSVDSLKAGTYTFTVIDNAGCEATYPNIFIDNRSLYFCAQSIKAPNGDYQLWIDIGPRTGKKPFTLKIPERGISEKYPTGSFAQRSSIPAGTYQIEIIDSLGCRQQQIFSVGSTRDTISAIICEGDFYSFKDSTYTQSGVYKISGCSGSTYLDLKVDTTVDCRPTQLLPTQPVVVTQKKSIIDPNTELPTMQLFPNPADKLLTIQLDEYSISSVRMLAFTGQEVKKYYLPEGNTSLTIDVSSFLSGTYIVQAITARGSRVAKKIIIK